MVMSCAKRFSSQELEVVSMAKKMPRQAPHLRVRIEPKLLAKLEKSREKNAHTLTGEIVTRLEQSYEADEQATIAEQFTDLRQRLEESRALIEKERSELKAQGNDFKAELAKLRKDSEAEGAELVKQLQELEREAVATKRSAALVDILLGENQASREILREIALLLANTPDWAATRSNVEQMATTVRAVFQNRHSQ